MMPCLFRVLIIKMSVWYFRSVSTYCFLSDNVKDFLLLYQLLSELLYRQIIM